MKAEQLNQNSVPEGREVVQVCNSRLINRGLKPSVNHQPLVHGKRDDGSQVVDAALVRDPTLRLPPGLDQYLSVPSNVRAPPAHPR